MSKKRGECGDSLYSSAFSNLEKDNRVPRPSDDAGSHREFMLVLYDMAKQCNTYHDFIL